MFEGSGASAALEAVTLIKEAQAAGGLGHWSDRSLVVIEMVTAAVIRDDEKWLGAARRAGASRCRLLSVCVWMCVHAISACGGGHCAGQSIRRARTFQREQPWGRRCGASQTMVEAAIPAGKLAESYSLNLVTCDCLHRCQLLGCGQV